MTNTIQFADLAGHTVYDCDGNKIGDVGQMWYDDETGNPSWVSVRTGLFGMNESFVPIEGLRGASSGDLQTPFTKQQVKDAPNVDPEHGHLDETEEDRLYRHYGVTNRHTAQEGMAGRQGTAGRPGPQGTIGQQRAGTHDTIGRDKKQAGRTDDAMTRSEEQLRVGTESRETGRARLRKYVTTEKQQIEVPVTREEVRVEREPITEANRDAALSGPDITEAEHEVTLREERPVVDTETVPVERVRLAKEQVADTETVAGEVRKEHIEADTAGDKGTGRGRKR
ncbi:DUF2382 domain-containing protein [Actinokineospora iranica]|uniref:Conserved domain-containing protein n=1 Tax=Actinokineospora iranica TaxID=1271860 RepID=A0A1G6RZH8_9PSEU|nr:PRC and DUF2382 domain-containing protein [Actinokineospora iranica]SDD09823.1 conserved domain-containing protein [Actinokineospora iranica]